MAAATQLRSPPPSGRASSSRAARTSRAPRPVPKGRIWRNGWAFEESGRYGNETGGEGGFAIADNAAFTPLDSQLISPSYDLTDVSDPELAFSTMYFGYADDAITVDATSDGGATWKRVWKAPTGFADHAKAEIPLTAFAGKPDVRVRFHLVTDVGWYWGVDDVFVGQRDFDATPGGLVTGLVTDANTGKGLVGATVTAKDDPQVTATTVATPGDPALDDGLYLMFSPDLGKHDVTVAKPRYTALTRTVDVAADSTVAVSHALKAGQLTILPDSVEASLGWGTSATRNLTVKNTGGAPATVTLDERSGGFHLQALGGGAPLQTVKGSFSPHASMAGPASARRKAATTAAASGSAWQTGPDLPEKVLGNAVGTSEGKVYSAFGFNGLEVTSAMYVLDPVVGTWTKRTPAEDAREAPSAQFIDGRFYVVGGWKQGINPETDRKLEIYDPDNDTWSTGASAPVAYAGQGSAAVDGKLYTVGGCDERCGTAEAYAYDPGTDAWSRIADYPEPTSWESESSSTPICSAVESADSSFSSSLPAAAAEARRSAKLRSSTSSRVGGTSSSIWWRRSSSSVRKRTISASLFLFVTTGMRTKLKRRLRYVGRGHRRSRPEGPPASAAPRPRPSDPRRPRLSPLSAARGDRPVAAAARRSPSRGRAARPRPSRPSAGAARAGR